MSNITFETEKEKMDIDLIHQFLTKSYWAKGRTKEVVQISMKNSHNFGIFKDGKQVGFARVITDLAIYAYLMDVFIVESERGAGYGKDLVRYIMEYPAFHGLKKWTLGTRDADGLYEQFGFKKFDGSYIFMEKSRGMGEN